MNGEEHLSAPSAHTDRHVAPHALGWLRWGALGCGLGVPILDGSLLLAAALEVRPLAGWSGHRDALQLALASSVPGAGIALLAWGRAGAWGARAATLGGLVAAALGLIHLGAQVRHVAPGPAPGWWPAAFSLGLVCVGVALALTATRRARVAAQGFALLATWIGVSVLVGHLYDVRVVHTVAAFTAVPDRDAVALLLLGGGLLALEPGFGLGALLASASPGGNMARRVLPAVVLVPLALGWLHHAADRAGMAESDFLEALSDVTTVAFIGLVVCWNGAEMVRSDRERRRAETRLRHYTGELERSNRELQTFAFVASHDLQEPLRMVSSFTQLLAKRYQGKLGPEADEFIGYAVDGAKRMQQLILDLLAYSRVSSRAAAFERISAEKALAAALARLGHLATEAGATVTHDPLPEVMAEPTQLGQLLQNLVGNALKFRAPGRPPAVHVSARREAEGWRFSVRDNGIGIDPAHAERIFVIFQRLHTREEYPGTGIGLAICKRIVERHGGRIWVESAPGQGSTFHFLLPDAPPPQPGGPA